MGSKGGNDSVQRQEPWAPQAPYLQDTFGQAQQLFNSGGPQFFPGATYSPFSQQTEQGLGATEQRALGGSPVTDAAQNLAANSMNSQPNMYGAGNYIQQQMGGQPNLGGLSQFLGGQAFGQGNFNPSMNPYDPTAGGAAPNIASTQVGGNIGGVNNRAPSLQGAQGSFLSQLTGLPGASQNALQQTAAGESLQGNPYLDNQFDIAASRVTDKFNNDIMPGLSSQFSLAGRTGSDAQADVLSRSAGEVSDSLSQLSNQIYGGNYQAERDRQLQAAGQLGALSQNQQTLGLQAAGQGADLYNTGQQQDISRRSLQSQNDISRLGLGTSMYGNDANRMLTARGQDLQAGATAGQQDISRLGLAGQLYNSQMQNQLGAANLGANLYGQQMGQQTQMAGLANSLANQDYTDLDRLLGVGSRVEGLSDRALQDQISRFNHYQNLPQSNLANYIAAIQGNYGGTTTGQAPGSNRATGALGGAAAGSAFGPWGALAGGILGLLG